MTYRPVFTVLALAALSVPALAQERQQQAQNAALLAPAPADNPSPAAVQSLKQRAADSLVVVKYVWDSEAARRELEGLGVVVNEDGLVVASLDMMPTVLPDSQLKEFQILVPNREQDPTEIKATLVARDERSGLVFLRPAKEGDEATTQASTQSSTQSSTQPTSGPALAEAATRAAAPGATHPMPEEAVEWKPAAFGSAEPRVGDYVLSVGRLSKDAGYVPYANVSRVSTTLRGPMPLVGVAQSLTGPGSVVLDAQGRVIGFVESTDRSSPPFLTGTNPLQLLGGGPNVFVPIEYYLLSLKDPPTAEPKIPFLGAERLTGLTKELRQYYELGQTPAVQVGDVVQDSPAAKAGFKAGDVIVAVDGKPLERGDAPDELPAILNRTVVRTPVDTEMSFTLLDATKQKRDVTATLSERPMQVWQAERWYAEDLGYSVRELVFADRYLRKLPKDAPGVAVAFVRPQSNAQAAGMQNGDLIRKINQDDVTDLAQFKEKYQAFRKSNPTDPVVLEVLRGSETNILRIEVPR